MGVGTWAAALVGSACALARVSPGMGNEVA
jgi:hypothetical protein